MASHTDAALPYYWRSQRGCAVAEAVSAIVASTAIELHKLLIYNRFSVRSRKASVAMMRACMGGET
jgi:hypothetical protein